MKILGVFDLNNKEDYSNMNKKINDCKKRPFRKGKTIIPAEKRQCQYANCNAKWDISCTKQQEKSGSAGGRTGENDYSVTISAIISTGSSVRFSRPWPSP